MAKKEFIYLTDADKERMVVLYDEISERISEMARITAINLGLDIASHSAVFERHDIKVESDGQSDKSVDDRLPSIRVLTGDSGNSTACYLREMGVVTLCGGKPGGLKTC